MDHQGSSCLQCFLAFTQHSLLSPLWVSVPVPEAPALHRDSFTRLTLSHPFTDLLPTSLKKSFPCVPSLPQTGLGGIHWTAKENFSSSLQNSLCHLMSSCDKVSTRSAKLKKHTSLDFPGGSDGKTSVYNGGDPGSIPGSGKSPREGNGNPLQYYRLENPMDREAW